jgi:phosphopentomutase
VVSVNGQDKQKRRALVVVIDGCGIGAAPDAAEFGDLANCNTLANTAREVGGLNLPNMTALGLGNIAPIAGLSEQTKTRGLYGKLQECSNGKDTQTGHWEMMGVIITAPFPYYPNGFPAEVIDRFIEETQCGGILCNKPASGTQVLDELAEEHRRTRFPIVYTSGDSVFQIATNVDVIPLATLYKWSEIARRILDGKHRVGRVIARPFTGEPGNYKRLSGDRRDYAIPPPAATLLDVLAERGMGIFGVGKIEDIFVGQGLTHAKHTGSNLQGLELTLQALKNEIDYKPLSIVKDQPNGVQLIFTNLVDTDSMYGHRRNVKGYAHALTEIDEWLGKIMAAMGDDDLMIISSDHGNDPTAPGTDHTREFVPLLAYSPTLAGSGINLSAGIRHGFTDIAASLADWLGSSWNGAGVSFLDNARATV